jgi:hypothetical protein
MVHPGLTEAEVKATAESVLTSYAQQYKEVTVRSFRGDTAVSSLPYLTSMMADGGITHRVNKAAAQERIRTH